MANLLFLDESHRYIVNGEEVPSVSELCRFISREVYGDIAQFRLDNAAERGTNIHKACEVLDKYGSVDVESDILPYIQAYLLFRKEHSVQWEKIEFQTYHPTLSYAGTIDRYGTVDGVPTLLDIKSSSTIHKPLYCAQLNLYRMMLEARKIAVERLSVLHLKSDGKYRIVPFERNEDVPSALLTLHALTKKKPRKKRFIPNQEEVNG
jgi:hypothetical protein